MTTESKLPELASTTHYTDPVTNYALEELVKRFEFNIKPEGPDDDPNWYGYIPCPLIRFFSGMTVVRKELGLPMNRKFRFLDVGSGIGTKMALAHALGFEASGIERWYPYVKVSRRTFPHCQVFHGVAEEFASYHLQDVIYCYGLGTNEIMELGIYDFVTKHMKPGALFFSPRDPQPSWLEPVAEYVWRKPT